MGQIAPSNTFQPRLMLAKKVKDYPRSLRSRVDSWPYPQTLAHAGKAFRAKHSSLFQWVETNPSNIRIFHIDIHFLPPHGASLKALIRMLIYGCSRMLDRLVSSYTCLLRSFVRTEEKKLNNIETRSAMVLMTFSADLTLTVKKLSGERRKVLPSKTSATCNQCHKTFFSPSPMKSTDKQACLYLTNLSSII